MPYRPLGSGFLTGRIRSPDDVAADDDRRANPRFQGENFATSVPLDAADLAEIDAVFPPDVAAGERYAASMMGLLNA